MVAHVSSLTISPVSRLRQGNLMSIALADLVELAGCRIRVGFGRAQNAAGTAGPPSIADSNRHGTAPSGSFSALRIDSGLAFGPRDRKGASEISFRRDVAGDERRYVPAG